MSREILFRGKRIDNCEWVEGYYVCLNGNEHRIYSGYAETDCGTYYPGYATIDHTTVGQYAGLNDLTGKRFFDGDIFRFYDDDGDYSIYKVQWLVSDNFCGWAYIDAVGHVDTFVDFIAERSEIISNIYDKPELLEGVAK